MPLFAVEYTYAAGSDAGRDEVRPQHRAWLGELHEAGTVRTSGPYPDGSGALFIIDTESAVAVHDLLKQDPFGKAGFVSDIRVNEWVCVFEWRS